MDIDSFLTIEKCRLTQEYERLQYFKKRAHSIEALDNESDNNDSNNDVICSNNKIDNNQHDNIQGDCVANGNHKNGNEPVKDHMEQWVTNTFYSYFPGYNDEYHKRQRARFQEHKDMESIKQYQRAKKDEKLKQTANDSSTSSSSSNLLKSNGRLSFKTSNLRPETARYKLLRDLRHTDLRTILNSNEDDLAKLKRQEAELALAKQKEYQMNLLQQIEEKRQMLKALKEKEEKQERDSAKRLEKQLKMMKLEEQREKEKLNASRRLALDKKINVIDDVDKSKKVYKYFSSYSKRDKNDSNRSYSESLSEMDLYEMSPKKTEKECFHLSEKICPMCNGPLREFQNFCLHCQRKLLLGLKRTPRSMKGEAKEAATATTTATTVLASNKNNDNKINDVNGATTAETDEAQDDTKDEKDIKNYENGNMQNCSDYSLVCCNCYRFYTYCTNCSSNNGDTCRACQRKRNVCMQCRRDLCSFCLEEIACGKDVEQTHINECDKSPQTLQTKNELSSTQMHLGMGEGSMNESSNMQVRCKQSNTSDNRKSENKSNPIGENEDTVKHVNEFNDISEELNMERMQRNIEKRLVLFFKHYGDLIRPKRNHYSTEEFNRRKHNAVSMPLLCDMPKLRRQDINHLRRHM